MRAVRFGGFRAGGYSNETSQVSMLTLEQEAYTRRRQRRGKRDRDPKHGSNGDDDQESVLNWKWQWDQQLEINWSKMSTTGVPPGDYDNEGTLERHFLSRAYHTATLLLDRYLIVLGGMKCTYAWFDLYPLICIRWFLCFRKIKKAQDNAFAQGFWSIASS